MTGVKNMVYDHYRFMMITLECVGGGMNLSCWMTTVDFYASEKAHYPHEYHYIGDDTLWTLYCNQELTGKLVAAVGEQAEQICKQTEIANQNLKPANRR